MFLKKYKNLYKFKKFFNKYKKTIMILRIVMILASTLGMLLPYFISKRLIGITDINPKIVVIYSVIIMIIILFHHIFWYLWERIGSKLNNSVAFDIRDNIINDIMNTKYSTIKNKTSGYYLERINDDVNEVSTFYYMVMSVITDLITNTSFLVFIFFLNYQCGLVFLVGIIFLYIIDLIKIKKDMIYTEQIKILTEQFNSKINEDYRGIKDIKGLGIKEKVITDANVISEELSKIRIEKDKTITFYNRIKTFSQHLIESILFVFAIIYLIPINAITVVILLTIINYSGFMYDLVEYAARMKDYYIKGDFSASRILEMTGNKELFGTSNKKLKDNSIKVKNLSYAYEDDLKHKVLNNINLNIKPKTANVFIGSSGSGKSTLFSLLSKLLECPNNKIFIGGIDINELSENNFRNNVCIVNQEPFLLNDTILNNIKIVNEESSIEEIYEACKAANIYDEIMNFENGFDTIVSEMGSNLSGGEKQRIAIARAILKDVPILLFDEPTSALDKNNQELFLKTIDSLKKDKTVLVIAHKLNNYEVFDNVYEIKNSRLTKEVK